MSLKAYEEACLRAELFGQPKPNKSDYLEANKHLDVVEFEEVDLKVGENTAMLGEDLKAASGGLHELNTILNSTQTRLNRMKGVCGSLTNFFRAKITNRDNLSYSSEPSYVGQTNYDKDSVTESNFGSINSGLVPQDGGSTSKMAGKQKNEIQDINSALNDLQTMQDIENTSLASKATVKDIGHQVTSQMSKLDSLLSQADRAQSSLQHQNKQMRSFLK